MTKGIITDLGSSSDDSGEKQIKTSYQVKVYLRQQT